MRAYQAALAGVESKLEIGAGRTRPGTVNAAVVGYYTSTTFQELSAGSKKQISSILERFRSAHGDKRLHLLEQRHIVKLLGELRPHARTNWLSALRGLLAFAVTEGLIRRTRPSASSLRSERPRGIAPGLTMKSLSSKQRIRSAPRRAWLWPCRYTLPCENQIFFGWGRSTFATVSCMSRNRRQAKHCSCRSGPSYRRSSPLRYAII